MDRRFDVFLSYNSTDRAVVERIAEHLHQQRIEPWWDRWSLTPGAQWQNEIVEGLRASRACAVIVGDAGLGQWAREELAVALDLAANNREFRIFMVLLPGAPDLAEPSLAFLRTRSWVDLRGGIDSDGIQELVAAITGAPRRRALPVTAEDTCPYRGLEVFEEEHSEFFFGREDDVSVVVEKLKASRFLAVLGPSGSGKSSLLRAGVLPVLRSGRVTGAPWHTRVFSPGTRPLSGLAIVLTHMFPAAPVQKTLDHLQEDERSLDLAAALALGDRPGDEQLLLVIDQFEELFTLCGNEDERSQFLANLVYAATIPGGRVVVVVGMRADFYHRCAAYPELRVLVADHQFLVGPLNSEGLRRAIDEPARRVGLELETGLAETIIFDVEARPGSLPLLEHVLFEMWRRRRGTMLTLQAYVACGGVEGALAQRANNAYAALSPRHRLIARDVLLRLIQPGEATEDTRRRASMGELVSSTREPQDVEAVVQALARERLITTGHDDVSGTPTVDITHEALIRGWPELRRWIDEDREALRAHRHLTETAVEWDRLGRREDDLYTGSRLSYWKEHGTESLSDLERAFLAAGTEREARERSARSRRVRLAVGGVAVALISVAVVALVGLERVADQRDIARSRQLAAEAMVALPIDPARAAQLAADAYDLTPTGEAEQAVKQALETPGSRAKSLSGHDGAVEDAVFSPDGTRVLTAGDDGTVRLWEWEAKREPMVLRGHLSGVNSADLSADGMRVVSAGDDGTVRVWRLDQGGDPTVLRSEARWIWSAAFSPDGTLVVSAASDGTVRVTEWASGRELAVLRGHDGSVVSAGFSPDGTRVASAGADGTVRVWDWNLGREVSVLRGHEGAVSTAAYSPDGTRVVSAGADGTVRVWDLASERGLSELTGHVGWIDSVAFSPDGTRVVSAGEDRTVQVWSWAASPKPTVLRGHQGAVNSAAFSPDGNWVVSAASDGTVRVWDWAASGEPTVLRGHRGEVRGAAFSPDDKRVVSAGTDGTVRVWDWAAGRELAVLRGHDGAVNAAAFSSDGKWVVSAGAEDGTVRVWAWAKAEVSSVLRGHRGAVASAAFSPDGNRVVSAGEDGTVRVWDWAAGSELVVLRGHRGWADVAAFSPDGSQVVSAGQDRVVRVWEWATGSELVVLRGHESYVSSAAFGSDGVRLISAGDDASVRLWDVTTGRELAVLLGHQGSVHSASFSPEGARLVTAGDDRTVRIWDWATRRELTVLRGHDDWVSSAVFDRAGTRVVSAGADSTIWVWDCTACHSVDRLIALVRSPLSP